MPDITQFSQLVHRRSIRDLEQDFQNKLKSPNLLIDVHTHLFTIDDVPRDYLGLRMDIPAEFLQTIQAILDNTPGANVFIPSKYRRLLDNMLSTPEQLRDKLTRAYSGYEAILVVLMMDMRSLGRLNRHTLDQQINVLESLMVSHPGTLLPFLAVDPNQPDFIEHFKQLFARENRVFHGVKLYPSLGYLPSHPNLMNIYGLCEDKQIPITTHCSSALVNLRKRALDIEGIDRNGTSFKRRVKLPSRYSYKHYFNAPSKWIPVLKRFPSLKLNLAHFGGAKAWEEYGKGSNGTREGRWINTILSFLNTYRNVYSDFSYTMYDNSATELLLQGLDNGWIPEEKVLYGSDFFLIENEGTQKVLFDRFRSKIGEVRFSQMSKDNNMRFLF